MTGTSNAYSSVLRNVANIATITLSLITTHVKTISRVKTLKHQSPHVKRYRNIGNGGWGLKSDGGAAILNTIYNDKSVLVGYE